MDHVKTNGKELVKRLRKATGKKTRIVGITYPDVILGGWVSGVQDRTATSPSLSVVAFKTLLNPALKEIYTSVGGKFVDVTDATGPTRRSSRPPRWRRTARSRSPSPRSASSRTTAPTATSTPTRRATA